MDKILKKLTCVFLMGCIGFSAMRENQDSKVEFSKQKITPEELIKKHGIDFNYIKSTFADIKNMPNSSEYASYLKNLHIIGQALQTQKYELLSDNSLNPSQIEDYWELCRINMQIYAVYTKQDNSETMSNINTIIERDRAEYEKVKSDMAAIHKIGDQIASVVSQSAQKAEGAASLFAPFLRAIGYAPEQARPSGRAIEDGSPLITILPPKDRSPRTPTHGGSRAHADGSGSSSSGGSAAGGSGSSAADPGRSPRQSNS